MSVTGEQKMVRKFLEDQEERRKDSLRANPSQNQGLEVEDILAHSDGSNVTDEESQEILEYMSMLPDWQAEFTEDNRVKYVEYTGPGVAINGFELTLDNDIGSIEAEAGGEVADNPLDAILSVEYGKQARDKAIRKYNEHKDKDIRAHEMPAPLEVLISDFEGDFDIDKALNDNLTVDNLIQNLKRYDALTKKHGERMPEIAGSGSVQPNHATEIGEDKKADDFIFERFNGGDNPSLISVQAPDFAHFNASGHFINRDGEEDYEKVISRTRELVYDAAFSGSDQTLRLEEDNGDKWEDVLQELGIEDADIPEHGSQGYVPKLEDVECLRDLIEYQMGVPSIMLTPEAEDIIDPETGESIAASSEYEAEEPVAIVVGDEEDGVEARITYRDIVEDQGTFGFIPEEDEDGDLNLRMVEWDLSDYDIDNTLDKLGEQMNTHHVTFSWEDLNIVADREEKRYVGTSPFWKQVMLASAAQNEKADEIRTMYDEHELGDENLAREVRKNVDQNGVEAKLPSGDRVRDLGDEIRNNHSEGIKKAFNPGNPSFAYTALIEEGVNYRDEFDGLDELVEWVVDKIYWEGIDYSEVEVSEEDQTEFWEWIAEMGYDDPVGDLQEVYGSVAEKFLDEVNRGGPEALLDYTARAEGGA